jgi:hypothetical protein
VRIGSGFIADFFPRRCCPRDLDSQSHRNEHSQCESAGDLNSSRAEWEFHRFSSGALLARRYAVHRLRKKWGLLSSRAKRGICFFAIARKKAVPSGKPGPRDDSRGVFPQPLQPEIWRTSKYRWILQDSPYVPYVQKVSSGKFSRSTPFLPAVRK